MASKIQDEIDELVKKYDLNVEKTNFTLNDLTEGVEPIVVNSIEEYEQALARISETSDSISEGNVFEDVSESNARATKTAKFNVYASLEVSGGKITSVNYKDQSLTGYILGLALTKGSTSCKVSTDKKSSAIKGTATVTGYIILEGIGNIYSKDHTVSGAYRV